MEVEGTGSGRISGEATDVYTRNRSLHHYRGGQEMTCKYSPTDGVGFPRNKARHWMHVEGVINHLPYSRARIELSIMLESA